MEVARGAMYHLYITATPTTSIIKNTAGLAIIFLSMSGCEKYKNAVLAVMDMIVAFLVFGLASPSLAFCLDNKIYL